MGSSTTIGWTHHTFNPWWGCAKKSRGCRFCYAAKFADRYGHDGLWRAHGPRRFMSDEHWREPLRWNRKAERAGVPALTFCASMADVFERHAEDDVNDQLDTERARLWGAIMATPWLRWQLLTKRPENVLDMVPWGEDPKDWPGNVWIGASVEHQACADERVPLLQAIPATVRFLSVEPLVGPIMLCRCDGGAMQVQRHPFLIADNCPLHGTPANRLEWIICGGESGALAKIARLAPEWVWSLRKQAAVGEIPFFFKQTGTILAKELGFTGKGDHADEWPTDWGLRQDFPVDYEYTVDRATVGV